MSNQRKQSRSNFVGAYVTDDLKYKVMEDAKRNGMNVADWVRHLMENGDRQSSRITIACAGKEVRIEVV